MNSKSQPTTFAAKKRPPYGLDTWWNEITRYVANHLVHAIPGLDPCEAYSAALLAVVQADKRYTPNKGTTRWTWTAMKGYYLAIDDLRSSREINPTGRGASPATLLHDDHQSTSADRPLCLETSVVAPKTKGELFEELLEALRLAPSDARLLRALFIEELSQEAYAVRLGISESTVCIRLGRLMDYIRKSTAPDDHEVLLRLYVA